MVRRLTIGRAVTYVILVFWAIVCLFPVYWLAVTSIKPVPAVEQGPRYLPFVDFAPDLSAWRFILFDSAENLVMRFVNSVAISVTAALASLLAALLALYALSRFPWPGFGRWLVPGMLATRLLPPALLVIPFYMMAQATGLLDTRTGLILAYAAVNLPVAVWLLQPVLGLKPTEQEEAARLDGASHFTVLFSVLAPMLAGGIAATLLLLFVLCWNEYLLAVFLANDTAETLTGWLMGQLSMKEAQAGSEAQELSNFSAAATLMIIPLLAASGLVHRWLGRAGAWRS